jgi:hypothetical protein
LSLSLTKYHAMKIHPSCFTSRKEPPAPIG